MLNEYTDLHLDCMDKQGFEHCDPLKTFNSPQSLGVSLLALISVWIVSSLLAWFNLTRLSAKYE